MALGRLVAVGSVENRAVRVVFGVLLAIFAGRGALELITGLQPAVDLEIPLRAATRWLAGGQAYLPSAFNVTGGPDLPFLYPPPILPLVAPLTWLPRDPVLAVWVLVCAVAAIVALRRLGFGWVWVPIVMLWPPVTESIVGGNVQVLIFLAGVILVVQPPGRRAPLEAQLPPAEDPALKRRPAIVDGLLAAVPTALKVSQPHLWVYLLARRPRAAVLGLLAVGAIALLTLPLVGIGTWTDWLTAAGKSSDPNWIPIGYPLSRYVPQLVALAIAVATVAACLVVPPRLAAPWLGVLSVVGAPALHLFGLMALLPAMLVIRREVALVAAIFVSTGNGILIWTAVALVGCTLLASHRAASLRDPAWSAAAA